MSTVRKFLNYEDRYSQTAGIFTSQRSQPGYECVIHSFIPSYLDRCPGGGPLQGGIKGGLLVMLVEGLLGFVTWMVLKLVKRSTTGTRKIEDVEDIQDDSFRSSTLLCNTPHPPAPLIKMCSTPASLQSKRLTQGNKIDRYKIREQIIQFIFI